MKAIDPVCQMEVDVESAEWTSEYEGKTYYFCAPGCKRSFDADPERYLAGDSEHDHGDDSPDGQ
ncbi:MAG TPA: YHS domain-containing protein [Anaerolineales bacterium]|nr:YHS domain-containing protein [Anaerolineales bacterium]